jgi:hypothetical protein
LNKPFIKDMAMGDDEFKRKRMMLKMGFKKK